MRSFTRTAAGFRPASIPQARLQPLHHTSAPSSSPAKGSSPSEQGGADRVPAAEGKGPAQTTAPSPENKAGSSNAARKKTVAEKDEELRLKLEGRSGEGGSAGIEYEGGKAEGLKRGVKSNMFRVI
jgi:hypothetical protein